MALQAVAFTKVYLSSTGVESPDSFVEVGNIFNIGEIGIMFNEIDTSSLSDGYDRKLKGTVQVVQFPVVLNYDPEDEGQQDWREAGEDTTNTLYYFKITYNDASGSPATPSTWEFQGKVNGFKHIGGGANDVRKVQSAVLMEMDTLVFTEAGA